MEFLHYICKINALQPVLLNTYEGLFLPACAHVCLDVYVIRGQGRVAYRVLMWTVSNNSRVTTYPVPPVSVSLSTPQ